MAERGNGPSEGGVGRRLRRYQERFEPAVTRVLLAAVFAVGLTAQFVRPVGDALQDKAYLGGALLGLIGYVLYDAVKELSSSVRVPTLTLVNSRQLGSFVSEAFQARRVEISFLGYTGETLHHELYHRLEDLFDNRGPIRKVVIRMLVPDFEKEMTVPSKVGEDGRPVDDRAFRERMSARCQEYEEKLSDIARRLTATGRLVVECEYRCYPGIPRDKICIFNRLQVLHGLYDLSVRMHHRGEVFFDPKGYRTDLNVWHREGTAAAEAAVSTWIKHFDDLWELATVPQWRRGEAT
ncbi:hypothetical protein ACWCPI_36990 [Streptomyces sp. NPDC001920]